MKVEFSPAAEEDLLDIATYVARCNPGQALTFVDELEGKCDALGRALGIGTCWTELGDGIRMLPHGRDLIFRHDVDKKLRIERITHGARVIRTSDFEAATLPDAQALKLLSANQESQMLGAFNALRMDCR